MTETETLIYREMLERLYAAVTTGPGLNCRPHNSRQRVDLALLARAAGVEPQEIVEQIFEKKVAKLAIKPPPAGSDLFTSSDKRTAIDVVFNRLTGIGLGHMCAVVHNAQTDQRDLYKRIREQLETLAETKTDPSAESRLLAVDKEQQKLHDELTAFAAALFERPDNGGDDSFHELIDHWLDCASRFKCGDDAIKVEVEKNVTQSATHSVYEARH